MWIALEVDEEPTEIERELRSQIDNDRFHTYIARNEKKEPIAFIDVSIRYEYVDGAKRSPAGYIEGIYIIERHRRQGIGAALIAKAEQWAGAHGCAEIGSDCDVNNDASAAFHTHLGYKEVYTSINFIKTLTQ